MPQDEARKKLDKEVMRRLLEPPAGPDEPKPINRIPLVRSHYGMLLTDKFRNPYREGPRRDTDIELPNPDKKKK